MITSTQLYWLTRLDHIKGEVFLFVGVLTLVAAVIALLAYDDTKAIIFKRVRNIAFAIGCVALPIGIATKIFLPTTQEMAAILVIPQIANSEKVQEVGGKIYDLAVEWMDALKPTHTEAK